jgi:hypothetical protein
MRQPERRIEMENHREMKNKLVSRVEEVCQCKIKIETDNNYHSRYQMWIPVDKNNLIELELSFYGPFITIKNYKIDGINRIGQETFNNESKILYNKIEEIINEFDLIIIPLDVLRKEVPNITGKTELESPTGPTVYNCLFGEY